MNPLLTTLIERKLILDNSVLTGRIRTNTLGGVLQKVSKRVYYDYISPRGFVCHDELNKQYVMEFNDLEAIDGMDLKRYARVYNIKADGSKASVGKKRGRKPKVTLNKA